MLTERTSQHGVRLQPLTVVYPTTYLANRRTLTLLGFFFVMAALGEGESGGGGGGASEKCQRTDAS